MKVFVSHSSADNQFGTALTTMLREKGAEVWYDSSNLGPGHLIGTIGEALTDYPVFTVVLSKDAFASTFVYQECSLAYSLYSQEPYRVILPVTASPISFQDFTGRWLFLEPFKRIEAPGYQPLAQEEALERVADELGLNPRKGDCVVPAGATAEELTAQGKAYCFQLKFDCAIRFLKRATEVRPDYFSAWHNLAWTYRDAGRFQEALPACERTVALRPNNSYAWGLKAIILEALDQRSEALAAAERALSMNPGYGRAWTIKGWMLYEAHDYVAAHSAFEKAATAHQPDTTGNAENGLAVCMAALGHPDDALAICEKLLSRQPLRAVNWTYKGRVLADAHRFEQALAAYNHALSLDSTMGATWKAKAQALKALGRDAEARHAMKKAQQYP